MPPKARLLPTRRNRHPQEHESPSISISGRKSWIAHLHESSCRIPHAILDDPAVAQADEPLRLVGDFRRRHFTLLEEIEEARSIGCVTTYVSQSSPHLQ